MIERSVRSEARCHLPLPTFSSFTPVERSRPCHSPRSSRGRRILPTSPRGWCSSTAVEPCHPPRRGWRVRFSPAQARSSSKELDLLERLLGELVGEIELDHRPEQIALKAFVHES